MLESEVTNNHLGSGGQHKPRSYREWLDYVLDSRPRPFNPQTYDLELVGTVDEIEECLHYLTALTGSEARLCWTMCSTTRMHFMGADSSDLGHATPIWRCVATFTLLPGRPRLFWVEVRRRGQ